MMQDRLARGVRRYCCQLVFFMRHHLRFEIRVVLLLDHKHVSPGAARCPVSDLYHEEVMIGSCLLRGYVPAVTLLHFVPVRELSGGCS